MPLTHLSSEKSSFESPRRRSKNAPTLTTAEVIVKLHSPPSIVGVLALATVTLVMAGDPPARPGAASDATVIVHATHFAVAGRAFDEVDALGSAIEVLRPHSVAIHACGPGTTRALRAAVYRLRAWPLHLQVHERSDAACTRSAALTLRVGQRGLRIDDEEVDRYWNLIAP
jgi:hypothetical protein